MQQSTPVEPAISRFQLRLVWAAFAAVAALSAFLIFVRYLNYVENAQDAAASSGMWAGGDLALELIILLLFLVPTAALVFVIRKSESAYTTYAKVLLGLSLTAPASAVLMVVPFFNQWQWGDLFIFRLFAIPIMLFVLLVSYWMTRSARARRFIVYALLTEGLTLVALIVAFVFLLSKGPRG